MRCEDVIRELAASTGEPDQAAMAQHLAGCPACATWARRAGQLDALWDATRPPEPAPEAWDSVWATIARQLEAPASLEAVAPARAWPSRNGRSSKVVVAHPAPAHPAAHRRPWRLAAIAFVGLAQAAAILITLSLVGLTPGPVPTYSPQSTQIVQKDMPPPLPGPSVVRVALPVRVEVEIEEGPLVMIRADGQVPRVVMVMGQGMASGLEGWGVAAGGLGRTAILAQERAPGVDPWYVMFNQVESIATPRIAAR